MSTMIKTEKLSFTYPAEDGGQQETSALREVDLEIEKGSFVTILGHNGSGKSTLAKHMNAVLLPTGGSTTQTSGESSELPGEVFSLEETEQRMAEVLSTIDGVGRVRLQEPDYDWADTGALLFRVMVGDSSCTHNEIVWALAMKNGDAIELRQTVEYAVQQVVTFDGKDTPMDTAAELQALLDTVTARAQTKNAVSVLEGVYDFYDAYDWIYTNATLADIHYSANLSDDYWEEENNFCTTALNEADQMLTSLYTTLAASPCRSKLEGAFFGEGFFEDYDGDGNGISDEELLELVNRESELISQYYTQVSKSNTLLGSFFPPYKAMAQTMVDLIRVRNELASCLGFDSYEEYANVYLYARDYTPEQMSQCLDEIQQKLVPLYVDVFYDVAERDCSEEDTYEYVRKLANAIGGTVLDAFELMDQAGLYDIAQSSDKFNSSFETYLTSYGEPFVFMNAGGDAFDQLTFAHEFGHFCNDYASYGSTAGVDVSEFFSTGMEYLSLCYGGEDLTRAKMADSLGNYVEQGAYASFERQMYSLTGNALSAEGLYALYEQVALDFGFDSVGYDRREFVDVTHFYTNPMYVFSYVVSNDAAMQLYQLEQEQRGAGLELYEQNLTTEESYFLAFLDSAGLQSPFESGRISSVKAVFESVLE